MTALISDEVVTADCIDKFYGYTVYGHLTPSMKWYFGITKRSLKKRWGKDGSNYKSSPRFYSAIQKYGWDNIHHHVVGTGFTKEEACNIEQWLISQYNTMNGRGYNCTAGGDGLHGFKRTPEQLKRLSESHKGQMSHASKPVWCLETGQFFMSAREASLHFGWHELAVAEAARGYRYTAGGLHWAYVGKGPQVPHDNARKCVLNIDTMDIYTSATVAAKQFGVSSSAIGYAARHSGFTSCGYHWAYISKYEAQLIADNQRRLKRRSKRKIKTYKLSEGQQALF